MFFIPYLLGKLLLIPQDLYKAFFISLTRPFTTGCKQTRTTCTPEGNVCTVQETEQCTSALGSGGRLKDQGGALSSVRRLTLLFLCLASVVTCVSPVLWFPARLILQGSVTRPAALLPV